VAPGSWSPCRRTAHRRELACGRQRRLATVPAVPSLPNRLAADLIVARKARDAAAVNALRTALAAFANAEAPAAPERSSSAPPIIGIVEHERLVLTIEDHLRILREQIALRSAAAREYDEIGRSDAAVTVRAEIGVLERYLPIG
jgi:uncharacterized protein